MLEIRCDFDPAESIIFIGNGIQFCINYNKVMKYKPRDWINLLVDRGSCIRIKSDNVIHLITNRGQYLEFSIDTPCSDVTIPIPIEACKEAILDFANKLEQRAYEPGGTEYTKSLNKIEELSNKDV
jgi:hypothetical protein